MEQVMMVITGEQRKLGEKHIWRGGGRGRKREKNKRKCGVDDRRREEVVNLQMKDDRRGRGGEISVQILCKEKDSKKGWIKIW